jgi:2-dehydropantoate 2-reductase
LRALRDQGLTIRSEIAGTFTVQVDATDSPESVGEVDYALFCVKTYDIEAAARSALPLVGAGTTVIPVQNGIDSWERIGAVVGRDHLVGAVVYLAAARREPTVIDQRGAMRRFQLGEFGEIDEPSVGGPAAGETSIGQPSIGGTSNRIRAIASLFERAGIQVEKVTDVELARWTKFVMVCATGGVMALTRLPAGPIFACPETRQLFLDTMNEVVAIGLRLGVRLEPGLPSRFLDYVEHQMGPSTRSSQLEDLLAGRRLELESLNGTVVRLGNELGIETPMNDAIYAALKPYVDGSPAG